jgi:hypothetical protein
MVNSSTNINRTNNHLSPKESLNSNGQQFHQYQQNKQSPKIDGVHYAPKKQALHSTHPTTC